VSPAEIPFFAGAREMAAHGDGYLAAIGAALVSGRALQGPQVAELEARLAGACGRAHAVTVGSGTDALFFALAAHGIGPGDEVLVPAFSFIATASCIVRAGARPVFVDVDDAGLLDLESAAAACGTRARALIAVQLYGQMLDPAALEAFARERELVLVEDAAQAFGAATGKRRAGSVGRVSCLSFDPTKTVSAPGSGGAVLCDDDALAERLRRLRWHGRDAAGAFAELGYNSQLPTAAAAVLLRKLELDAEWTRRRREVAAHYDAALDGTPARAVGVLPGRSHVFHKYVLRVPAAAREGVRAALAAQGVTTLVHYAVPLPRQPLFGADGAAAAVPGAETLAGEVLSLPIHAFLADDEVARVTTALRSALARA